MAHVSGAAGPTPEPDMHADLKTGIFREWVLSTAALLALTFCLSYFSDYLGLKNLDNTLYDRLVGLLVQQPASDDIVIVAIDDGSIQEMGHWPWPRAQHATLLEQLSEARAVAFDLVFSEPNPAYPDDDAILAQAIRDHGRVVLPLIISNNSSTVAPPMPILGDAAMRLGTINIYPDSDGVIRSVLAQKRLDSGLVLDHISLALLDAGQDSNKAQHMRDAHGSTPVRIAYARFSNDLSIVPYNRVLDGSIPPTTFKDKYVLVGSWGSGLGDTFATPYSGIGGPMPGVEVLANVLNGGLSNQWIEAPDRFTSALLCLIPVLISCIAFRYLSPQRSFMFAVIAVGGIFATVALALYYSLWWLAPSAALIGTGLAYPVWSWRSQHAALQHIDGQLALLRTERLISSALNPDNTATRGSDMFPSDQTLSARVRMLHDAIDRMRMAQHQRNETLRFLSHDMRAPLNSILALTDLKRSESENTRHSETLAQFDFYAYKTLALVDGFVELSRAEAIELRSRPTNLTELIAQCCDGAWVHAQQKQIQIDTASLPEAAWINADAGLLERAWTNLLDNALKYSPNGTAITCTVERDNTDWVAQISDQGRGMDAASLEAAFSPFTRIDEQRPDNPPGVGLGLAFVRTVITRHGGHIDVQSQPGVGTRFTIRLPALDLTDPESDTPGRH